MGSSAVKQIQIPIIKKEYTFEGLVLHGNRFNCPLYPYTLLAVLGTQNLLDLMYVTWYVSV